MVAPDGADDGIVSQATHLFASLFFVRSTDRVIVGWGGLVASARGLVAAVGRRCWGAMVVGR